MIVQSLCVRVLSVPDYTRTTYLLNDPIDNQWILQDVLADAGVEHDSCDRRHTVSWACVMLMSKAI